MAMNFPCSDWLALLSEPAVIVSTDGRILNYNVRFETLVQARLTPGDALATFMDASSTPLTDQLRKWARSKQSQPGTLLLHTAEGSLPMGVDAGRLSAVPHDGGPVSILLRCRPRREAGERFRLLGEKIDSLTHEVVARQQAEQAAIHERERFRITLSSIGDAVIATDERGCVTFMNPVAEVLTGWSLRDAEGVDSVKVFDIVNEDTRAPVESPVTRVIREGVVVGLANHTILRARGGAERPIDDSGAPIRDQAGELVGTVLVFRDISKSKAAQQAIRESEQRFRTMADAAPALIWVADSDGRCTYFNRQWLNFTGRPEQQEFGDGWKQGVHPEDLASCLEGYESAFEAGEPFRVEYRLRRHDGVYRWMLDHGVPRLTADGQCVGYIGSCIDITEHRNAARQLQSINETLEDRVERRTAQLRDLAQQLTETEQRERRRLAQILHDNLQQLLVAARMRAETVVGQLGDADCEQSIQTVQDLIQEALAVSRSLTVELSPPVLYDGGLCAALPWLARRVEEQHDLRVQLHVDPDAEPHAEQTRVSLFQGVRELLLNVVKHAGIDEATVSLARSPGGVQVTVEDHGKGFDVAAAEAVRGDDGGFGLFSLKERIGFLGGSMSIQSARGRGTRVVMRLQDRARREPPSASQGRSHDSSVRKIVRTVAQAGIRVILADDHRILREGIVGLLMDVPDIDVVAEACDGQAAVELAREHRPDVVVMDITMPRLNGIEATRLIRREMPDVNVIGLSMHDSDGIVRAMVEAGAVQMLAKGGPSEDLIQAIREAAARRPGFAAD